MERFLKVWGDGIGDLGKGILRQVMIQNHFFSIEWNVSWVCMWADIEKVAGCLSGGLGIIFKIK